MNLPVFNPPCRASRREAMKVAVGFNPRCHRKELTVAARRLNITIQSIIQASIRDAILTSLYPWAEGHGSFHCVALRRGKAPTEKSKTFTVNGNSGLMKLVKANDEIEKRFSTLTLS